MSSSTTANSGASGSSERAPLAGRNRQGRLAWGCRRAARSVHPRAGGETQGIMVNHCPSIGSSPRGRGTLLHQLRVIVGKRFIPARAGNAYFGLSLMAAAPVHPRAGGERVFRFVAHGSGPGSSPRGRGTLRQPHDNRPGRRFIPARAGNAGSGGADMVHVIGSSPRGRGTLRQPHDNRPGRRFIPARAGNASGCTRKIRRRRFIPARRGTHHFLYGTDPTTGPSPRGRGTPPKSL